MFYMRSFDIPGTLLAEGRNVSMQAYWHESVSVETGSSSNSQPCYLDGLWPPNLPSTELAFTAMLGPQNSMTSAGDWFSNLSDLTDMADGSIFSSAGFEADMFVWS